MKKIITLILLSFSILKANEINNKVYDVGKYLGIFGLNINHFLTNDYNVMDISDSNYGKTITLTKTYPYFNNNFSEEFKYYKNIIFKNLSYNDFFIEENIFPYFSKDVILGYLEENDFCKFFDRWANKNDISSDEYYEKCSNYIKYHCLKPSIKKENLVFNNSPFPISKIFDNSFIGNNFNDYYIPSSIGNSSYLDFTYMLDKGVFTIHLLFKEKILDGWNSYKESRIIHYPGFDRCGGTNLDDKNPMEFSTENYYLKMKEYYFTIRTTSSLYFNSSDQFGFYYIYHTRYNYNSDIYPQKSIKEILDNFSLFLDELPSVERKGAACAVAGLGNYRFTHNYMPRVLSNSKGITGNQILNFLKSATKVISIFQATEMGVPHPKECDIICDGGRVGIHYTEGISSAFCSDTSISKFNQAYEKAKADTNIENLVSQREMLHDAYQRCLINYDDCYPAYREENNDIAIDDKFIDDLLKEENPTINNDGFIYDGDVIIGVNIDGTFYPGYLDEDGYFVPSAAPKLPDEEVPPFPGEWEIPDWLKDKTRPKKPEPIVPTPKPGPKPENPEPTPTPKPEKPTPETPKTDPDEPIKIPNPNPEPKPTPDPDEPKTPEPEEPKPENPGKTPNPSPNPSPNPNPGKTPNPIEPIEPNPSPNPDKDNDKDGDKNNDEDNNKDGDRDGETNPDPNPNPKPDPNPNPNPKPNPGDGKNPIVVPPKHEIEVKPGEGGKFFINIKAWFDDLRIFVDSKVSLDDNIDFHRDEAIKKQESLFESLENLQNDTINKIQDVFDNFNNTSSELLLSIRNITLDKLVNKKISTCPYYFNVEIPYFIVKKEIDFCKWLSMFQNITYSVFFMFFFYFFMRFSIYLFSKISKGL